MATKAKSATKGKKEEKAAAPARPTRCPGDFKWKPRPKIVEAAEVNDVPRCEKLLERGEDANKALHYAIGRGRLEVVKLLLERGADVHTEIKEGDYWVPPPRPATPPPKAKKSSKGKKKA